MSDSVNDYLKPTDESVSRELNSLLDSLYVLSSTDFTYKNVYDKIRLVISNDQAVNNTHFKNVDTTF